MAQTQLSGSLASQANWDSNFARAPAMEEEFYLRTSGFIGLTQSTDRQALTIKLGGSYLDYQTRADLNSALFLGRGSWQRQWTQKLCTQVNWQHDAYVVDRLEFFGRDAVARDDVDAQLGWGRGEAMNLALGARSSSQRHSNSARQALEFNEREAFARFGFNRQLLAAPDFDQGYGKGYGKGRSAWEISLHSGQRRYSSVGYAGPDYAGPDYAGASEASPFDFDYRGVDLALAWMASSKMLLSGRLGYTRRRSLSGYLSNGQNTGDELINDADGKSGELQWQWRASEKWRWQLGYSRSQPAQGEASDSPQTSALWSGRVRWQLHQRWLLSASVSRGHQDYVGSSTQVARRETLTQISPLSLEYHMGNDWSWQLRYEWNQRQSPLAYRDFHYSLVSSGLQVMF